MNANAIVKNDIKIIRKGKVSIQIKSVLEKHIESVVRSARGADWTMNEQLWL